LNTAAAFYKNPGILAAAMMVAAATVIDDSPRRDWFAPRGR
jgi:hypothetical protein